MSVQLPFMAGQTSKERFSDDIMDPAGMGMRLVPPARRLSSVCLLALLLPLMQSPMRVQAAPSITQANRPTSLTATVGDVLVRIDGPKLWTLSRIEYKGALLGVEDSAYGTVVNIRNVGNLGTAHFLDVPGHPGEVEKEQVNELRFFVDDRQLRDDELSDQMKVSGQRFRLERNSTIRSFSLQSELDEHDGLLFQSVRIRTKQPVDLKLMVPLMYAWTPTATHYLFGSNNGEITEGAFQPNPGEKTRQITEKGELWGGVYDPASNKGTVSVVLESPEAGRNTFLVIDAPKVYRKFALMPFSEAIVPAGFDATYRIVTGFVSAASEAAFNTEAKQKARELEALR
jgi:hypothetical protein